MNYLNPYSYFGGQEDVENEYEEDVDIQDEYVRSLRDDSGIRNILLDRGYITPASVYINAEADQGYYPGSDIETGAEGQIRVKLNQELLQEYIERLQNLNENRNLINQRIESQLNEQIEINNNSISEIEESIPEQSENLLGLNTLNQQKVQLYLLNIEYSEKILNNMIQSDLTRIEEINGMINAMTRSNSSLVDVFTEEVQGELETLQININENERNLANLNRDKRKLRQELENLQVEFESLIEERIRQEEEMRRLSLMDSRKRYMDEGESSSLKKSRY